MSFSVGLLYSTHDLLDMIVSNGLNAREFSTTEERFTLAPAKEVYRISQECNWIRVNEDGLITVSERGESIQALEAPEPRLRLQIADLIAFHNPSWARRLMHGREEARISIPADATQCFSESGLFQNWSGDIIRCWDELGKNARVRRSDSLQETGRQAERWSIAFETTRTGEVPHWQSLDSAFAGFDILSRKTKKNPKPFRIEVKGSERPPSQASFFVTKNEWRTANKIGDYNFHLWFVSDHPKLYVVDYKKVAEHISVNQGDGVWSAVEIPYKPFLNCERNINIADYSLD